MAKPMRYASTFFSFSYFDEGLICKKSLLKWLDECPPLSHHGGCNRNIFIRWMGGNFRNRNSKYEMRFIAKNDPLVDVTLINGHTRQAYKIAEAMYNSPEGDSQKGSFYIFISTNKDVGSDEKPNFLK